MQPVYYAILENPKHNPEMNGLRVDYRTILIRELQYGSKNFVKALVSRYGLKRYSIFRIDPLAWNELPRPHPELENVFIAGIEFLRPQFVTHILTKLIKKDEEPKPSPNSSSNLVANGEICNANLMPFDTITQAKKF